MFPTKKPVSEVYRLDSDANNPKSIEPLLPWLPILFGGTEYLTLLFQGNQLLNDSDVYWHLTVGRWIVDHRAMPHVDVFSYTMLGKHWITSEWLSEVLYLAAFSLAGWAGIVVLAAFSIGLAFLLLMRSLLKILPTLPAAILVAGAMTMIAPHLVARPHVLVFPALVCWASAIIFAVEQRRAPALTNLLLIWLWANLHGSFTLGLVLIVPFALEALWTADKSEQKALAIGWFRFGLLAGGAACITPYGPESLLVTFRVLGLGGALSTISEWQPQNFSGLGAVEVCLLLGMAGTLYSGFVLPPFRIAILLVLVHEALAHKRYVDILGLVAPLLIANSLARHISRGPLPRPPNRPVLPGYIVVVAALMGVTFAITATSDFVPPETPVAAVEKFKGTKPGPILNDYAFGGYLIYLGIPTFIDSRAELYGAEFITRYQRAVSLSDVGDFIRLLDDYQITRTLLSPSSPAVGLLDRLGGWQRIYADEVAVVHVHRPETTTGGSRNSLDGRSRSNGLP